MKKRNRAKRKQRLVFVIEEKKGKKYAKPIPKRELLKPQNESIAELQRQVNVLKSK